MCCKAAFSPCGTVPFSKCSTKHNMREAGFQIFLHLVHAASALTKYVLLHAVCTHWDILWEKSVPWTLPSFHRCRELWVRKLDDHADFYTAEFDLAVGHPGIFDMLHLIYYVLGLFYYLLTIQYSIVVCNLQLDKIHFLLIRWQNHLLCDSNKLLLTKKVSLSSPTLLMLPVFYLSWVVLLTVVWLITCKFGFTWLL